MDGFSPEEIQSAIEESIRSSEAKWNSDNKAPLTSVEMLEVKSETKRTKNTFPSNLTPEALNEMTRMIREDPNRSGAMYTLDDINQLPTFADSSAVTFASSYWELNPGLLTQSEYICRFNNINSVLQGLETISNVVVAGGAAIRIFHDPDYPANDIDIFIYGLDTQISLWCKIDEILDLIIKNKNRGDSFKLILTKGVLTILLLSKYSVKIQIILRAYPTIESILYGFDIGASSVAFDGTHTYFSLTGVYALVTQTIIIDPENSSNTFIKRLLKYFNRGFRLMFLNLDENKFKVGESLKVNKMELTPTHIFKYSMFGDVKIDDNCVKKSDYDTYQQHCISEKNSHIHNVIELLRGRTPNLCLTPMPGHRFMIYGNTEGPVVKDTIFANTIKSFVNSIFDDSSVTKNMLHVDTLFSLDRSLLEPFMAIIKCEKSWALVTRIHIKNILMGRALNVLHSLANEQIQWWNTTSPMSQHTSSTTPHFYTPKEWYGDMYFDTMNLPITTVREHFEVFINTNQFVKNQTTLYKKHGFNYCVMCQVWIIRGSVDTVVLSCGHVSHWSSSRICCGIYTSNKIKECEGCKHALRE